MFLFSTGKGRFVRLCENTLMLAPTNAPTCSGRLLLCVRQAWRVTRKRNQLGCGGHAGDLQVQEKTVSPSPGKYPRMTADSCIGGVCDVDECGAGHADGAGACSGQP